MVISSERRDAVLASSCLAAWLRSRVLGSLTAALVVASAAADLRGQTGCGIGTDGFDPGTTCCPPTGGAQAVLPDFGFINMDGRATIFEDCLRPATNLVSIVLEPPVQENCDHYRIRIKVSALGWTLDADFRAKYCRTWMDFDAQGQCRQRWRFLINADVDFVFDELNPPPLLDSFVPFCVAAGGSHRPHYTGHVDYVCTEVDGSYAAAIEIHHLPGCISHATCAQAPASTVPAPFQHLNESLHIAGPLPFSFADPGAFLAGPGNLFPFVMTTNPGDTLRESRFPWSSYACLNESRIVPGLQSNTFGDQPGNEFCACAVGTVGPIAQRRYTFAGLDVLFDCPELSSAGLTRDENPFGRCGALGPFAFGNESGLIVMRVGTWSGGLFDGESLHTIFGRVRHDRYHWAINPLASPAPPIPCASLPLDPLRGVRTEDTFVHGVGTKYTGGQFGRLEPFASPLGSCGAYTGLRYDRFVDIANMFLVDGQANPPDIDGCGREFYSWIVWSLNPDAL